MLVLEMPPRLYVFRFDVTVHLAAHPHRAVLAVHPDHYAAELPPLRQALLKRGKPTRPDLPVSEHYRVGGRELVLDQLLKRRVIPRNVIRDWRLSVHARTWKRILLTESQ